MKEEDFVAMRDVLVMLYDESNRGLDDRGKAVGLTRGQLMAIDRIRRRPGLTQKELAATLSTTKQYTSQLVGRLEEQGYVACKVPSSDGRKQRLSLTDYGKEAQASWWAASRRRIEEELEHLTPEEQADLFAAFHTVLELMPKLKGEGSAIF